MKTIVYSKIAERAFEALPNQIQERIESGIERYALTGHGDIKALKGQPWLRLRIGDYRVVFTEDFVVIDIINIGHRREIYE